MINEELLAASALLVHDGALLVRNNGFINFLAIVQCWQPKSAVLYQAAKLFQQHWRQLKGITTSILPLKMAVSFLYCATNIIIKPTPLWPLWYSFPATVQPLLLA